MNLKPKIRSLIIEIICLLYVLLFVYAAVSKILDFENFQVQLGQSPLLSVYAWWVSYAVPAVEILISLFLCLPKLRNIGLFAAFSLMVMFSCYIFIILNFSSFVPCSCGGILEKMDWESHLVFNLFFVFLAAAAFFLSYQKERKFVFVKIVSAACCSSILVAALFFLSENKMQHDNPFIRRYPQHPIMMTETRDLKFNSYYIAGFSNGRIYLGNYTTPLELLSFDSGLKNPKIIKIVFSPKKMKFKLVRILIRDDFFYLLDDSVPTLFSGLVSNWTINREYHGFPNFNLIAPMDDDNILFRSSSGANGMHVMGVFSDNKNSKVAYNNRFLQKQIDGVFDTDGMLIYGPNSGKAIYVYYYRNQFIVSDSKGAVIQSGHTIDTNSTAKIKVTYLKSKDMKIMSAPPSTVNKHAAACGNLLFVHSNVKGSYEENILWKQGFIIDVYDTERPKYIMSFAIYGIEKKKLRSFYVTPTHLYALLDDQLVAHEIRNILRKEFRFGKKEASE